MSTVHEETIEGYFYFRARIKELEKDSSKIPLVVIFKGSEAHGKNWSPDCKLFEGTLAEFLEAKGNQLPTETYILKVKVGNSEAWSKEDCPFRSDKKTHLETLPTVMLWNGSPEYVIKRLEGKSECTLENIHQMLLPNAPTTQRRSEPSDNNRIGNALSNEEFATFEFGNEEDWSHYFTN